MLFLIYKNMKKEIITIGGSLGSGKSSTTKGLEKILGYTRCSTGDFMRKIAEENNMPLEEFNDIGT